MKLNSILFCFLLVCVQPSLCRSIVLNGCYHGKDVFVQNPQNDDGIGYCVWEVQVNGLVTLDTINASTFRITLSSYGFSIGDSVHIVIKHRKDCTPIVLNDAIGPIFSFEIVKMKVDSSQILQWVTRNEQGALPFIVEQFRWNKWVGIGEVKSKGTLNRNDYSFKIPSHTGMSVFRVKQCRPSGRPIYSRSIKHGVIEPEIFFKKKDNEKLVFTATTDHEIYDKNGNIMLQGKGDTIPISELPKGTYYLNYGNKTEKFVKKR